MRTIVTRSMLWTLVISFSLLTGFIGGTRVDAQDLEADSFLRSGNSNTNEGANYNLVLRASGRNRALVRFDTSELSGTVASATLRLYIVHNANN